MHITVAVAPRTGAWIEIDSVGFFVEEAAVAPRTGAWIEIRICTSKPMTGLSRPARARGLKYNCADIHGYRAEVAPRTGAWIEIISAIVKLLRSLSRAPHGRVD